MNALRNRRFRLLLLALVGVPVVVFHVTTTLGAALLDPGFQATDFLVYFQGARDLGLGHDPYTSFFKSDIYDPTLNLGYIYPPLLAWALQPLVAVGEHGAVVLAELISHACLAAFVLLLRPLLALRSWEASAWLYVLVAAWFPVRQNLYGAQVNVLLLLLVTVWLAVAQQGRAASGIPLGASFAIKFLTAPLLGYLALRRAWPALAVALAAVAVLWALAAPGWLPEYWARVFPHLGSGTGFRENIAPSGTLIRLFQPSSFYGQAGAPPPAARVLTLAISLGLLALTAWRLGWSPREGRQGLVLEASAVVAVAPIVSTLTWPSHVVLLLLPIGVLLVEGVRRRDRTLVAMVAGGALMLGPVRSGELMLIAAGVRSAIILRPLAETGVLGMALILAASLRGLAMPSAEWVRRDGIITDQFGSRR